MSTRIKYSCPNCAHVISEYLKRGFPLLHTGIGVPTMVCTKCSYEIKTGLQPWSMMTKKKQIIEMFKTTLNVFIICSIFGGLFLGGGLFFIARKMDFHISIFDRTTEGGRFKEILFYLIMGTLLLGYYKYRDYNKYARWVEDQLRLNRKKIPADEFKDKYPDW